MSYPEIYEMQVRAIFEAVYTLKKEGVKVEPEIMIPIIMNENELKLIIYGKKIEGNRSAAWSISSGKFVRASRPNRRCTRLARWSSCPRQPSVPGILRITRSSSHSGTNDLTQTTIGLSRDDFNAFMPDYTQFDLLEGDPFQYLNPQVRGLIALAVKRGKMTRPDLEARVVRGARERFPENIRFCMKGPVSTTYLARRIRCPCSKLAIAHLMIEKKNQA